MKRWLCGPGQTQRSCAVLLCGTHLHYVKGQVGECEQITKFPQCFYNSGLSHLIPGYQKYSQPILQVRELKIQSSSDGHKVTLS